MRRLILVISTFTLLPLNSCDDGDVITFELDFEDTFQVCESGGDLVFYKTKDDPSESLSLKVTNLTITEFLDVDENNEYENDITISSTNPFNYRTYSNTELPSDLFCNAVPNSEVKLKEDIKSTSGTARLKTVLVEDDNDGIPAELESTNGINPIGDDDNDGVLNYLDDAPNDASIGNENDAIEDGFDTDGDGIPNFIDADDDGDNILTKDENPDPDGNGIFDDAQDTDGDGTPDYLDPDDDGDDVLTRDEENDSQDNNPANDITNSEVGADYLNPDVSTQVPATAYREHTIHKTYTVTLVIENFDLTLISLDVLNFGTLEDSEIPSAAKSRKVTPEFN